MGNLHTILSFSRGHYNKFDPTDTSTKEWIRVVSWSHLNKSTCGRDSPFLSTTFFAKKLNMKTGHRYALHLLTTILNIYQNNVFGFKWIYISTPFHNRQSWLFAKEALCPASPYVIFPSIDTSREQDNCLQITSDFVRSWLTFNSWCSLNGIFKSV